MLSNLYSHLHKSFVYISERKIIIFEKFYIDIKCAENCYAFT